MGMHANLHQVRDEKVEAVTRVITTTEGTTYATLTVRLGLNEVTMFMNDLASVETIAFHLNALIHEAREEHGWM